jgi:hypothetical protein
MKEVAVTHFKPQLGRGNGDKHSNTYIWGHVVAQWLGHYATDRKVADSIPDVIIFKFT